MGSLNPVPQKHQQGAYPPVSSVKLENKPVALQPTTVLTKQARSIPSRMHSTLSPANPQCQRCLCDLSLGFFSAIFHFAERPTASASAVARPDPWNGARPKAS